MRRKIQITQKILSVLLCALVVFSCVPMSVISASAMWLHDEIVNIPVYVDGELTDKYVTLKDADKNGYYDISTADELYAFSYGYSRFYTDGIHANAELKNNIMVNTVEMLDNPREWMPIGDDRGFVDCFNGNGYKISSLYINDNTNNQVGLFSHIAESGKVENLGVTDSYFNGDGGGIASFNYGTITNCYNENGINGIAAGIVYSNNGTITNCYNTGNISGNSDMNSPVGGIVYSNNGTITNCYNTGKISGNAYAGGLVGENNGTITNCYNTGEISGVGEVGGLVGLNTGTITKSYNKGTVSSTAGSVGGVVGQNGSYSFDYLNGTITNCYNTGAVSNNNGYVGGLVGEHRGEMTNSYSIGSVTGVTYVGGVVGFDEFNFDTIIENCYYLDTVCDGGIGKVDIYDYVVRDVKGSAEAKTYSQFENGVVAYLLQGEQTETVWGQKIGTDRYPVLGSDRVYCKYLSCKDDDLVWSNNPNDSNVKPEHSFDNGFCSVCSTYEPAILGEDNYYKIDNAGKLYWFAEKVNSGDTAINGKLTADIVVNKGEMTAETNSESVRHWTPIGNYNNQYIGRFNGGNHTISGLYYNNSETDYAGLFGYAGANSTVENVGVINSYINGNKYVSGIVGYNKGTITNIYNTSIVNSSVRVNGILGFGTGGVAGYNEGGEITNCYNTGYVSGVLEVGGVVGCNEGGTIKNCYNIGKVLGTQYVGGVASHNEGGTITNSHNTGTVYSNNYGGSYAGGVVGSNMGTITNSYNTGTITGFTYVGGVVATSIGIIENSYNTGAVTGSTYVGGVAGFTNGATNRNTYNIGVIIGDEYVGDVFGFSKDSTITNCYYLAESETDEIDGTTAKTEAQFNSGEVAYLLQGEQTEQVWGQTIGTDPYPVLTGDKVYLVKNCKNKDVYSNTENEIVHNFNKTHVCKNCYALEEGETAGVYSYSISLGGNIAVNYHMVLDESVIADENAKVVFEVPNGGETETVEYLVKDATKNGDFYVFTCEVAAKEMTSEITCRVVSGENESSTFTYSVKQYTDILLANTDNPAYAKAVPLVKAMLNYGASAQLYFDYKTDSLANEVLSEEDKILPDDLDLSAYASEVIGEENGVIFYGSELTLKSKTGFNIYLKVNDEVDVEKLNITVNGTLVNTVKKDDSYQIKVTDIPAQSIDSMYEIKIGGMTVKYSVFSYGHLALTTYTKETLKNTIRAMYAYNQEAINYIA